MSIRKHDTDPSVPAFDECEWQAQERARQIERGGAGIAGSEEALVSRYRTVSRALREPPMTPLPPDFAASIARRVETARTANEERLERLLSEALVAALGLSGGVVSVLHGREWLHAIGNAMPGGDSSWLVLAVACVGLHWIIERWHGQRATR